MKDEFENKTDQKSTVDEKELCTDTVMAVRGAFIEKGEVWPSRVTHEGIKEDFRQKMIERQKARGQAVKSLAKGNDLEM